jgi:gliding motility-associated-like protein
MKKLLLLLISSLLVISTANSQIYKLNSTTDKQTFNTCKGMVASSGYVEGPSNTYYESNDGDYYTFYSGGGPLRINFNYANFDSYLYNGAYDQLEIWDKSTVTGAPTWILRSTAYGQNDHKYFTSNTGYITVRLNTNGDGWGGASGTGQPNGWQAFLGCTPTGCNGNLPASDVCSSAPVICNLDGYCGATSGWYTADNVSTLESTLLGCTTGGWTIQNNSWLAFIANNSTATFTIKSSNCSDASKGMQAVVLATTNCTSFTIKSTCIYDGQGTFSLTASALTVGTKYYIMIDGGFGNDCDYTVSADSGIEEVKVDKTSATICEGSSVAITASGGLSYKWMPGGATTATINVSPTTSTTYTCTVTGKCDVETPTCVVTVKPKPVASATPNPLAFCSGGATNIALTSSLASTTYVWIAVKTGGTTTGSSNGSGSSIAQTLTATSTTPGVVTYNVTPTTNGCSGNNLAVPVTVNPLPTVTTTPASQTFCSGGTTGIALTSNLAGTTFSWTVLSSTGVSGASAGSGTTIAQTLTATGTVAGTVTYEITPTSASPASCPGTKKTVSITVNPRPTITPTVAAQNLCSGGSTSIGLQSDISGATYTWTVAVTGGVTGASNGSGSNIVQTLTASGTTTGTVEYTITATTPAPASCSNSAVTKVLVTVYPTPTISINTPAAICVGQSVSLTATVAPAGGTFSWTPGNLTTNPINVSPTTTTSYNCQYTVNGCSNSASRNVTVNPLPSVSINTSSSTICAGKTTTLTASSPDAGGTYLWAPGGATTPAITVSPAGNTTYTVTYRLATSCAQTATSAITVNTVPTVTVTPTSASICAGVSTTLNTNANPAGGTYAWAPGGASTPSITVSPSSSTTYTLTYTGVNGCSLSNSSAAITVTPLDNANFSYAKSTYCGNASDTVPTITGIPGGTFTATPAGLVFLNTTTGEIRPSTSTLNTTYSVKYTTNGACPNSKTVNLTIATNPTAAFGFDFTTYCQYSGTVSPTFIGASSAGTFSATPAGLVFVSVNTGVIDLNTSTPGSYLVRNIIAKNGTCNADTSDFVPITITAAPVLTPSSKNQSICSPSATNITLSGGTSYDWTVVSPVTITGASNATGDVTGVIAQTLTTSDVVPGIVHYIVTPKGGTGCIGKSDSVHITVNPVPTVSATPVTPTVCSGLVTDIKLSSNIPTATFTWTVSSSTGATGAIGGTGPIIAQALTATTSAPGTVVYHITPSAFGSCDGTPIDVSVTVNPNPTTVITIPSADQTICSGETTNIHLTSSTDSTKFTWTVNQNGVSGGSNGSGTDINQLLTVLGSTPGKAIYSIVGSSNGCSGSTAIDSVTVNPIPTLIVTPLKQEICSGAQTNIALVSNLPGAIFSWTITPRSITGGANGSTGVGNIIQTLTNPGSLADSVTYHIVATVGGCSSNMAASVDSVEASIIVNPKPIAYAASPVTICSGDTTNIVITGNVTGSTFSYKAITATVIGSGDGSGDTIKQRLSVNTVPDFVTYTIIPTSLQGCIGNPTDVKVNVNPRPTITFQPSSSHSICSGDSVSVTMLSNVAGTIISWTPRTSIITGANSGSGTSPVLIKDALSVLSDTAVTIIYDVTASAGGCSNTALSSLLQFTVNPSPKIIASAKSATICDGDVVDIALSSNVTGTDFNWAITQTGVTGAFVDSNKTEIKQALNLTGNVVGTVVYTITANSPTGCKGGATENIVVTVNPLDNPAFHYSSLKYCQNAVDPSAIITGGVPGVFTAYPAGLFITDPLNGKINLNASTPGDYIVQFTTSGKCSQKGYQNVVINPAPSANTDSLKIGDSNCGTLTGTITGITTVSGTAPFKYEWKNNSGVIVGTTLILDSVPPGAYTLTITDTNGCSGIAGNGNGFDIKFLQTVKAEFTSDVISGDTPLPVQFINKSTYKGTINYFWDFGNGNTSTVKDPTMTFDAANIYTVCLYVDDGGKGCRDTACSPIEVFTNSNISIVPNVFTPNGDGINDILMITATGLGSVDAQIYNRWGQKEYEWHTLNGGWDGFTASGVPATEGTYYIILQAVGADKNKTKFPPIKQSFTLLR